MAELAVEPATELGGRSCTSRASWKSRSQEQLALPRVRALLRELELPLAYVLSTMERTGVIVDAQHLLRLSTRVAEDLIALEAKCRQLAGREFNVGSPRQLEAILFDELALPVIKRTKTARSTDADVLEELASQARAARGDPRAPHAGQAQEHLPGCLAA